MLGRSLQVLKVKVFANSIKGKLNLFLHMKKENLMSSGQVSWISVVFCLKNVESLDVELKQSELSKPL